MNTDKAREMVADVIAFAMYRGIPVEVRNNTRIDGTVRIYPVKPDGTPEFYCNSIRVRNADLTKLEMQS